MTSPTPARRPASSCRAAAVLGGFPGRVRPMDALQPCPCGSGSPYASCCRRAHLGEPSPTAEALMRSRYSAYALGEADHLFRTWHPRTRPPEVRGVPDLTWEGLVVTRVEDGGPGDEAGLVGFEAHWRSTSTGEQGVLRELSRFERRRSRWVYVGADPEG
ncbi:YchJ family protein [Nocardioides aquaticus]